MASSANDRRPMAGSGNPFAGSNVGGISANAEGGLEDAARRSADRLDDDQTGAATIGEGLSGGDEPRLDLGGTNEPGEAPGAEVPAQSVMSNKATPRADQPADPAANIPADAGSTTPSAAPPGQRTAAGSGPPESPDEGPAESWGRAVSEVVVGTLDEGKTRPQPAAKR